MDTASARRSYAAGFYEPGGPEVLRLIEVPEPHADAGRVRVRVRTAGVQPVDAAVVGGVTFGDPAPFLRIPGNEFAGVVDQVGADVDGVQVGDEVLGFGLLGSYAEYVVVTPDQITRKPPGMPWTVAGGLSAPGQTAHIALEELAVVAGDTVLVHGAAGAVGHMAVQLCRLAGATVAAAARPSQHEFLRALGAVPLAYGDGFVDRVRALAPDGIDASLDGVGGRALTDTLQLVGDPGRVLTLVEHDRAPGLGVRTIPRTIDGRPARNADRLALLADLHDRGLLDLHLLATFPLARAADAHRRLAGGDVRGKIVLDVSAAGREPGRNG